MARTKIFISSVQSEFAEHRAMLADYIRKDALLGKFFEVFIFEEMPADNQSPSQVYLKEVEMCDIYLGLFGELYGWEDAEGVSPTEREYDRASELYKTRLVYITPESATRHAKEAALIKKLHGPHKSLPHNPLIAEAIFLRKYIEKTGTGTEDILTKCADYGLKEPKFVQEEDFRVVIYREPKEEESTQKGGQKSSLKSTQKGESQLSANEDVGTEEGIQKSLLKSTQKSTQKKHRTIDNIYSFFKTYPFITREQLSKSLGITPDAVKKHLQKLKNNGRIVRVGGDRGGHWEVVPRKNK